MTQGLYIMQHDLIARTPDVTSNCIRRIEKDAMVLVLYTNTDRTVPYSHQSTRCDVLCVMILYAGTVYKVYSYERSFSLTFTKVDIS